MSEKQLFEAALGVAHPCYESGTEFDVENRRLTIGIGLVAGSRSAHPEAPGEHPVHDTRTKRHRHLNFFQHDCFPEVRVPRLKLPDGRVALVGESWHRVHAICPRHVDLAVAETSSRRGHRYLTLAADVDQRKAVFVMPGRSSDAVAALDKARRQAQRPDPDPDLKGLRWSLLKDRDRLSAAQRSDLDALIARAATQRTARAWLYREHLRDILDRKQINVVSALLRQWCTNAMRSKVEPMKDVARMIRRHFDGIVAWTQPRQTNGLLESLNGHFQAAKRKARGYRRFETMRTVFLPIAGKLDFQRLNPHAA